MGGETYHFDAGQPVADEVPRVLRRQELRLRVRARLDPDAHRRTRTGRCSAIEPFIDSFDFKQLINAEFGPDGSLYVLDYGTGVLRRRRELRASTASTTSRARAAPIAEVAAADQTSGPAPLDGRVLLRGLARPRRRRPSPTRGTSTATATTDSTAANPTFTYDEAGRYTATLTVTDDSGQTGNASVNIVAGNTAPTVTLTVPPNGGIFEYGDTITYCDHGDRPRGRRDRLHRGPARHRRSATTSTRTATRA